MKLQGWVDVDVDVAASIRSSLENVDWGAKAKAVAQQAQCSAMKAPVVGGK